MFITGSALMAYWLFSFIQFPIFSKSTWLDWVHHFFVVVVIQLAPNIGSMDNSGVFKYPKHMLKLCLSLASSRHLSINVMLSVTSYLSSMTWQSSPVSYMVTLIYPLYHPAAQPSPHTIVRPCDHHNSGHALLSIWTPGWLFISTYLLFIKTFCGPIWTVCV